jgi:hypothetical protein
MAPDKHLPRPPAARSQLHCLLQAEVSHDEQAASDVPPPLLRRALPANKVPNRHMRAELGGSELP